MATKTFSSRADESKLAFVDALTRERYNMSFGQYCGSILIDAVCKGADLPDAQSSEALEQRSSAVASLKAFSMQHRNESVGRMSDDEIKQLRASRYE